MILITKNTYINIINRFVIRPIPHNVDFPTARHTLVSTFILNFYFLTHKSSQQHFFFCKAYIFKLIV